MQSFLHKLYLIFMDFISINHIKKILLKLKGYWQSADVSGKLLITAFFAPSMFVLLWLLAEVAYVIVFTLPGIIIKFVALILLFCIFWSAATYFYEKLHNVMTTVEAEQTGGAQNMEMGNNETEKQEKNVIWRRKA